MNSLEPLVHRRNIASLSLFYRYYFGTSSPELAQLVLPPVSQGYSDGLHDFSVTIPRCYNDVLIVSLFAQLESGIICLKSFPLTCDLDDLKSRINRHLLTVGSF